MNTEFVYYAAPHGGGKTKWLVEKALKEAEKGNKIVLWHCNSFKYHKFMEYFYSNYGKICTVHSAEWLHEIPSGSVVLIDDLTSLDTNCTSIETLNGKVKRVYITVNGTTDNNTELDIDPNQLTIDDIIKENNT